MKKLILSLTLIALLTASLGGAAFAQSQQEPLPEVTTETAQGSAPAQADASQSMYPAVHALVMAMTENHLDYDPEDPEFLWTSLYYMLSLYGEMDERSELTDDTLILPSEVVQDYAAALYPTSPPCRRSPPLFLSASPTAPQTAPTVWPGATRDSHR